MAEELFIMFVTTSKKRDERKDNEVEIKAKFPLDITDAQKQKLNISMLT